MTDRRFLALVIAVGLLAIAIRLAVMWPKIGIEADDPDNYLGLAKSLASGRGFAFADRPTAYRPPLYPMLLAPVVQTTPPLATVRMVWGPLGLYPFTWGVAVLHLALGAATVGWTMLAARRWGLGPIAVAASGIIVALDPVLVFQSRSVMTETLAAMLLAWAMAATARGGIAGSIEGGLAFGVAALCRPSTLASAALAVLLVPQGRFRRGVMLATIALALAPWAIRNTIVFGRPIWTTTHGGFTLALANNPEYYRDVLNGPPGAVWGGAGQREWSERITRSTRGMTEVEADRTLSRQAWALMRERPIDFARASLARLGRFWAIAPSAAVYRTGARVASAAWSIPLFALAALGLSRRGSWRGERATATAIVIGLTCVHFFYWTDMRMRAPLIPSMALLAVSAFISDQENRGKKSGMLVLSRCGE